MTEFETFRTLGKYETDNLTQDKPSCFNGMVRVVKYKITITVIDEPIETIHKRLQTLYDENDNMHNHGPLFSAAKKHNYIFNSKIR